MTKIQKLNLQDSSVYYGYRSGASELPDAVNEQIKSALLEIQEKINEIIDQLNNHD